MDLVVANCVDVLEPPEGLRNFGPRLIQNAGDVSPMERNKSPILVAKKIGTASLAPGILARTLKLHGIVEAHRITPRVIEYAVQNALGQPIGRSPSDLFPV